MPRKPRAEKRKNRSKTKSKPTAFASPLYRESDWNRERSLTARPGLGTEPYRSDSRRDYARLIHSPAFRRLQGKTQLFPGVESDFFRNRLTHSLEVAQVAESIAYKINHEYPCFAADSIDARIALSAGLAHDLGHPPFGHNGERALDDRMRNSGGFEGNAQTLRILAKLEKKELPNDPTNEHDGLDHRVGLNLSYRSLASVLKYDKKIPLMRNDNIGLIKGYYTSESSLVSKIKKAVAPGYKGRKFKTVECCIMDIADDIAYSTYDLEDSLKAGFLTPLGIVASPDELLEKVADEVKDNIGGNFDKKDVLTVLEDVFAGAIAPEGDYADFDTATASGVVLLAADAFTRSSGYSRDGRMRTGLTSDLISLFIDGVKVRPDMSFPALSVAYFEQETLQKVEVLKKFTYEATIMSPRLKVVEHRGYEIVDTIYEGLTAKDGNMLLPEDFKDLHRRFDDAADKCRVICDFIAGMTDRYALEFYSRLKGENPQSIFKPFW